MCSVLCNIWKYNMATEDFQCIDSTLEIQKLQFPGNFAGSWLTVIGDRILEPWSEPARQSANIQIQNHFLLAVHHAQMNWWRHTLKGRASQPQQLVPDVWISLLKSCPVFSRWYVEAELLDMVRCSGALPYALMVLADHLASGRALSPTWAGWLGTFGHLDGWVCLPGKFSVPHRESYLVQISHCSSLFLSTSHHEAWRGGVGEEGIRT